MRETRVCARDAECSEARRLLDREPLNPRARDDALEVMVKKKEKILKSPKVTAGWIPWAYSAASLAVILIGWIMFGLGVGWGVHGSVVAGTVGE